MNYTTKLQLGKIRQETSLTWIQALPAALLGTRIQQNQPLWAALWPTLPNATFQQPHTLKGGVDLKNSLISLSKTLQDLQRAVEISRPMGLDTAGHEFQTGDVVCLKNSGTAVLQRSQRGRDLPKCHWQLLLHWNRTRWNCGYIAPEFKGPKPLGKKLRACHKLFYKTERR